MRKSACAAENADKEHAVVRLPSIDRQAYLRSGSCPAFLFRLDEDNEDDEHTPLLEDGSPAEWLQPSEELGAPRPPRKPAVADRQHSPMQRSEALRQISAVAERHRCAAEPRLIEGMVTSSKSTPNLSQIRASQRKASKEKMASLVTCQDCGSCCMAPFRRLAGLSDRSGGDQLAAPSFDDPESSCIIFDWDDTLLPTSFILGTVVPSLSAEERAGALPRSCPFWEALAAHAHVVGFVLRAARSVARVAIVTNSLSPWVPASGERYLPGLDLQALLEELQIPVYYARRHVPVVRVTITEEEYAIEVDRTDGARVGLDIVPSKSGSLEIVGIEDGGLISKWNAENPTRRVLPGDRLTKVNGLRDNLAVECRKKQVLKITLVRQVSDIDPYTEAKRRDMQFCMERFYGKKAWTRNVISIGDSASEQTALKQVLSASTPSRSTPRHLCKTVNLLDGPSVEQLSTELRIVMVWLSRMVMYGGDFDVAMDNLHELEQKLFK